jgi:putative oxidoreductase
MKWLDKFANESYALMRIMAGFMFSFHGVQIVFGAFSASRPPIGSQVWVGGVIELLAGLAVMLGFQTRVAAFLASGTMAVAYFQFHWKFQFGPSVFPALNQGELAALYSLVFLVIACRGGVKWCLDKTS